MFQINLNLRLSNVTHLASQKSLMLHQVCICLISSTQAMSKRSIEEASTSNDSPQLNKVAKITEHEPLDIIDINKTKSLLLARLNGKELPDQLYGVDKEYNTLHRILKQTVTAGESNSCLLVGNRGTGKSALVKSVLRDLQKLENEFCIVKLNGLTETNDRLALNEISRQLVTEQADQADRTFVRSINNMLRYNLTVHSIRPHLQIHLIIYYHY